ncbi:SDR family NAD(P)-dependent oxidoreductase [Pseudofrankia sp. DC12]|uniref:SDR family NAD(P)-dependent oxidoreductase n=1 Tax=Pseudofrankia sp. DC12 TaxID=683315 RepID=UPI0005F7D873|nr:SDR family NAD(P)-dependent oxidoreductase [Pseudofrankia sp. DC12]
MSEPLKAAMLVTGAGRGIGMAVARELATLGGPLVLADVDLDNARAVAAGCERELGVPATPVKVDVTRLDDVRALVRLAVVEYGRIGVVVNCAGIFPFAPAVDTAEEMWKRVLDVNLTGTFLVCREAGASMMATGGGAIVNISSGAGSMANPNLVAYSASKAGVVGMSRTLAHEWAPTVRVNVVAPGPTRTEGTARARAPLDTSRIPMGRAGEAAETARAVRFLASPEASFITGQTLHVNGGKFMP